MKYLLYYGIFFWLNVQGQNILQKENAALLNLFEVLKKHFPTDNQIIVVQTRWGCHSCNQIVTNFIKRKYRSRKHTFIIAFTSKKELEIQFSKSVLESSNVIIDKNNEAIRNGLILENSLIFYLENRVVKKKIILTPENVENELRESDL